MCRDTQHRTCVAVAGNDYCIVAASTRLSTGYSILTRDGSRMLKLYVINAPQLHTIPHIPPRSDKVFIASAGMQADMKTLHKMLHTRQVMYQHNNRRPLSANATAQLLSNTLYFKRFFPYYTFNMVAGLDDQGTQGLVPADSPDSFRKDVELLYVCCSMPHYMSTRRVPLPRPLVLAPPHTALLPCRPCFRQGCGVHVRRHWLL